MEDLILISAEAAERVHAESQQMDAAWLRGEFSQWLDDKRTKVAEDARAEYDAALNALNTSGGGD